MFDISTTNVLIIIGVFIASFYIFSRINSNSETNSYHRKYDEIVNSSKHKVK